MKVSGAVLLCTGVVCSILGGLAGGMFVVRQMNTDVLNVKRINIVEEDGRYALVLANAENLPGVIRHGKEGPRGHRHNVGGILYYNNKGDEMGGLITSLQEYDGVDNGGVQLSMDQLNDQGQTVSLMHWMEGEYVRSALRFWDLPTDKPHSLMNTHPRIVPILKKYDTAERDEDFDRIDREYHQALGEEGLWAERIYLGSEGEAQRKAMLELKDSKSQPRIRLIVDESDQARIEFLNAAGDVIRTLSEEN
ncbi:MAG: hypothetical protein AAF564_19055 [Bacteroidota bacterium]